ncbi:hypothetical protein PspLS_09963 [Pyricularia sp. CBS 133598]|nr:hypothetical protein PspLS_09963 [Pyricularia sp. CBS 133598]
MQRHLKYWRAQLADSSPAELLTDYPRPSTLSGHTKSIKFDPIAGPVLEQLRNYCLERHTSLFNVLLAAFRSVHYRLTGVGDANFGIPVADEDSLGCCLRIPIGDDETFNELVCRVGSINKAASAHQAVAFDILVSEVCAGQDEASRNPLVRLYFALHEQRMEPAPISSHLLDLEMNLYKTPSGPITGYVTYSTDLFRPETIQAMAASFREILRRGINAPHTPISELPLRDGLQNLRDLGLFAEERSEYARDASIVDVFREQVALHRDATAVADSSSRMTYAELDERSSDVATWLGWRGMAPETLVAVLAPRSCEAIIAFLGILKANLAYVPLDVNAPAARIASILSAMDGNKLLLIGQDVPVPDIALEDVDMVRIGNTLGQREPSGKGQKQQQQKPLPTSLAYVMFTSGSTGKPKGVMIEHRGVLRLTTKTNLIGQSQAVAVSHIANLGFDMATWEIYTALLNGGTVVCIDYMTVLDAAALARTFAKENIRTALFTPAILRQHIYEIPEAFAQLDLLLTGGEAIRPQDAQHAAELLDHGAFYNAYGPTENTGISTIFRIQPDVTCVNGVPIGHALSNSGAYVMDSQQNIVSIGVLGELVVTGDGLARGYINEAHNKNRFIHISIDGGEPARAYRTGDRARYRPDGQIEFFGRIDQQIKIRGHRIEPAEVEEAILGHSEVRDAAVVIRKQDGQEPDMIGFVTAKAGGSVDEEEASGQIEGWISHFESTTYADISSADNSAFGNDFIGWTSMYDGSAIDRDDMQEWLDDTVETLLDGQRPGRVLEVGTGSGMILYNVAKAAGGIERYVGIEPSQSAASFVVKSVQSVPFLAGRVQVNVGTATDLASLNLEEIRPDLVVINSVMQLFPSPEYLLDVMDTVIQIPGVKRLWFGDIRTNATNRHFLAARAMHSLGERATKAGIRKRIKELQDMEEELLVDPAFFTGLAHRHATVRHVEIIPKRMKATNELSAYRYGAIVHLAGPEDEERPVHAVSSDAWIDPESSRMDREGLLQLLEKSLELDEDDGQDSLDGAEWVAAVRTHAQNSLSLSAIDLVQLAEQAGYRVEISCARQRSHRGALDAVFHRYQPTGEGSGRVLFQFPTDDDGTSLTSLVNRPLQRLQSRRIEGQIRERLQAVLPSYMVPERIIALDEMPINANGKIDRKELARLAEALPRIESTSARVAPRDEIEAAVCAEFAAILGVEVGVSDSFFDLGGHSLMATRLAARLSRRLNAGISVKDIFDQPILSDLATLIRRSSTPHHPIAATPYSEPVEQSFAQGRLWFLDQLGASSTLAYVIPLATRLRGNVDIKALETALFALEERHETLRTIFQARDGIGMQVIQPSFKKSLRVIDMAQIENCDSSSDGEYSQVLKQEQNATFDLSTEPGWRVALIRLGPEDYILSIVMHHIISDGWSVDVLRQELTQFTLLLCERQLEYWKAQLANSTPAELLGDLPRPTTQLSGNADVIQFTIKGSVYDRLQAFCRTYQTTSFTVLLAVFRAAHYRLTGSQDATIGTPIANRNQPDLEGLIGFFVNTQCMRITVGQDDSFNSLVQQVRSTPTAAFANQDVPFERIVSAILPGSKDTSRNPLVQLLFALHSQRDLENVKIHLEGVTAEPVPSQSVTRLDLEYHLFQMPESLSGKVMYSTDLFRPESIHALVAVFQEILRRGLDQPQTPISIIPLTQGLDNLQLRDEDTITDYPRDSSVVDVFLEQVAACPDAIAVTDASSRLTYAELDQKSGELASSLRRRADLTPETLVGVLAPRSCEAIVAFFGILKAGLAYVPLDSNAPAARIATILSAMPTGRKLVLIGHNTVAPDIPLDDTELVRIVDTLGNQSPEEALATGSQSAIKRPLATDLAYVMFTSGSTGRPKGVMIEHRGIVRLATKTNIMSSAEAAVPVAHITTLAFDLSTWEIFAPLLNGGTVVCIDYMTLLDVSSLGRVFQRENVRAALLTPAFLKQCLVECPEAIAGLDSLLACGDRLDARDAIAVCKLAKCGIINAYGPTENTTFSTIYRMHLDRQELCVNGVPIGRPISNSGAYIMDRRQQPLPAGVMGELVVTGDGLARGYTDSKLNRDRFISITINGQSIKAYRTGDRARRRPTDGEIEFFGRMDQQIKIRGHRIEPAEAEYAMLAHEAVRDAAVVVRVHEGNEPELFGFALVNKASPEFADQQQDQEQLTARMEREIRNRLKLVLPSYMVPERIAILDQMPLNANGKVDRKELARIAETMTRNETVSDAPVAPSDELEAVVCEEFALMIGAEIGINDNFFNKGGHSLMATRLAARLSRRLNTRISVKDVFDNPVLGDLAETIRRSSARHSPIVGTEYSGPVEQSFAQGRLWFLEQLNLGTLSYMIPIAARMQGPLNVEALEAALLAIETRHETLRTTFHDKGGVGFQAVHPCSRQRLRVIDSFENCGDYSEVLRREQTRPFDLASEAGWRVSLLRLGENDHILSIVMHHIISDGWSVDVLRNDLARFYTAAVRNKDPLSLVEPLPIQYRDFSTWQKQQTAEHQHQLDYWRTQLAESSPAELLCDRPRPQILSGRAGVVQISPIQGPLYDQLLAFCRTYQTTPFTVLFAAFRAAHFRLTNSEDATVGIPIANRNRSELEHMIGFFVNTQCVRTVVGDNDTFGDLVHQVRASATAAFANQDVPFEQIVSSLLSGSKDTSRNPLVQLMFAFHPQRDLGELHLEGLTSELLPGLEATRLDAEFHLFQGAGSIYGRLLYSTDLFEAKTMENVAAVFQQVLHQGLNLPDTAISELPLLANDLAGLSDMGVLTSIETIYPRHSNIIQLFREQVGNNPQTKAVVDSSSSYLTYAQLDQQSDLVAAWLRQQDMTPESLVAVFAPRSSQAIVAFFGILKANLAYVPLDVKVPAARIESIVSAIPGRKIVLTGRGLPTPHISLDEVEFVGIDDAINHSVSDQADAISSISTGATWPSAESLAYVMFTSGSTGKPKGVMVTHRGIVRLVKETNVASTAQVAVPVAHVTTLAFDLSTWEIYAPLLNGGTVVCIDYMTLLDPANLARTFAEEGIRAALFTPAFFKQCFAAPETIAMLANMETLLACGDRLDAHDAVAICKVAKCGVVNAYGPTENTTFSTAYHVKPGQHSEEQFVNGVPIGIPISNSGALIMDRRQQLVPPGIMGELILTGDGLARGYLDKTLNANRFVQVEIDGRPVQAYRTGDRARYRPKDGQIEFFGRMDQQIKIRGHRIEPAEVEQVMLNQSTLVHDAVVVVQVQQGQEPEMLGFVTARADTVEQDEARSQVEGWGYHFEMATYADIDTVDNFGNDFRGWTSVYSREPIPRAEMQEWLDDTIRAIVAGGTPGRVLEIGTGSGMILVNLSRAGLERYLGIEPSHSAAAFVTKSVKSVPALSGRVEMHVGTAMDAGRMEEFHPDLVVLNSVIQYFPTPEYLIQVVELLARMPGVKQLFFGDVRSYALNQVFLASRALYTQDTSTKAGFREKMQEMAEREEELLIDPALFTSLASRLPNLVRHVEILPKRMKATNELSSFRYSAVVHIGKEVKDVQSIASDAWINFARDGMDGQNLLRLLKSSSSSAVVAVSNIPYDKTILEQNLVDSLDRTDGQDGPAWLATVRSQAARCPSLSGAELERLAAAAGFQVELSWARQRSQGGAIDAVFHRIPAAEGARVLFQFPADEGSPLSSLTNRPLRRLQSRRIEGQVREKLQALLPSYMVPGRIIVLDHMPLNPSGKVDRKELGRMAQVIAPKAKAASAVSEAPRNEVEAAVCEEFAILLGVEVGNIRDNFFNQGGHSLMATKLAARLSRRLDIGISVKDVFERPVLADLAAICLDRRSSTTHKAIPATTYSGPVEQSFAQRRLWFIDQLNIGMSAYILPHATRLRGPLQLDALEAAVFALQERHESLRTIFEERDGLGVQAIRPSIKGLRVINVLNGDYAQTLRDHQMSPFDLSSEPGWRVALLRLGQDNDDFILSIVMHHIISDGWSIDILRKELAQFYAAAIHDRDPLLSIAPLPVQYRDFATWQKHPEQQLEHQRQLEYWKTELADSVPAEIFIDRPRPEKFSGHAGAVDIEINSVIYERLQAFCRSYQTTPFTVLLTAFRVAHYRLTGAQSVTVGTPIANRNRPELESLIGFFVNTQCIKIVIDDEDTCTFDELVRQVRSTTTTAFANQDVPFERIVSVLSPAVRDTSRNPLVQLMFALHSQEDLDHVQLEGLVSEPVPGVLTTRFDLEVHLMQKKDSLGGKVLYSTDLFEPKTILGVVSCFQEVLLRGLMHPQSPISTLPLTYGLAELQREGQLDIKNTNYPRDSDVVSVFRQRVLESPHATAVVETFSAQDKAGARLTYSEIDQQSDKLEGWLRRQGMAAESLVGVLAPRSCETITAFLGILKANLAYIPLDVRAPSARLGEIFSSVAGRKVILLGRDVPVPDPTQLPDVEVVRIGDILNHQQERNTATGLDTCTTQPSPTSLAYVIFTSGSTGKPKGVMIEHRGILRLCMNANMPFSSQSLAVAHLANVAFDAATWEIYVALLNGGTVACIDFNTVLDPLALADACTKYSVRVALFSPSLLRVCLDHVPDMFRTFNVLLAGGDRLRPQDALRAAGLVEHAFFNLYGPTEDTVASTQYRIRGNENFVNGVPIGRALPNSGAYVMDRAQQLVPFGVIGELVVTGDGLARGYTDRNLDCGAFVQVTINGTLVKAYRTGDQARVRPTDGEMEFFGRIDQQIKIRGHRIETNEVEQAILKQDAVQEAAVIFRVREEKHVQMLGFVAMRDESLAELAVMHGIADNQGESQEGKIAVLAEEMVRHHLQLLLPPYMIPERFVLLQQLPKNANGKVDRKNLATMTLTEPDWVNTATDDVFMPTGEVEKIIHQAIADCINLSPSQMRQGRSFISMGGDSITAISLSSWIRKTYGVNVPISVLLSPQTSVRTVAALVEQQQAAQSLTHSASMIQPKRTQNPRADLRTEMLRLEKKLSQMQNEVSTNGVADIERSRAPSTFLVTGSTGFLGGQIVKQLLLRSEVTKVVCLVRANDDIQAWERMMDVALKGFWWRHDLADRLVVWRGDLTKPRLGLDNSRWARVSNGEIEAVIHNGAVVHWHLAYDDVRAANVDSTLDLLSALTRGPSPPPRFVYVSGGYFGTANETDDQIMDLLQNAGGYAQTKFISETLVRRYGISRQQARHESSSVLPRCVVVKPGLIVGDIDHGVCNLDDFLWRVVAAAVRVGGYNADEASDPNAWLLVAGSDQVATAVIDSCISPTPPGSPVNKSGDRASPSSLSSQIRFVDGIPVGELWRLLSEELGYQLRPMARDEWMQALKEDLEKQKQGHPLFPVAEFLWAKEGTVGSQQFKDEMPVCPQDEVLSRVKRSLLYLKSVGFFEADGAVISKDVFNRAGWKASKAGV